MAQNKWRQLWVPATEARMVVESLRSHGIETQSDMGPVRVKIREADLAKVCAALDDWGVRCELDPDYERN